MPFKVDPEVAAINHAIWKDKPGVETPALGDIKTRRQFVDKFYDEIHAPLTPKFDDVTLTDFYETTPDGHRLLLRWYTKNDTPLSGSPAVLFIHGGGMICLSVPKFDVDLIRYVSTTGVPFLSVEYRLAPEASYPTNLNDCFQGLEWLQNNAAKLGLDPNPSIAVMGDSGGGGLAAALTHLVKDKPSALKIAKQILICPMLDDRNVHPDPLLAPFIAWNYVDNQTAWNAVLSPLYAANTPIPVTAAPGRMTVEQARDLPDLYLDVGELDIFRDEGIEYVAKCVKAGVSTEFHVWRGVNHGWVNTAFGAGVSRVAFEARCRAIRSIRVVGG